jgi:hypothetical protein
MADDDLRIPSPHDILYGDQEDFLQVLAVSSPVVSSLYPENGHTNIEETPSHPSQDKSTTREPAVPLKTQPSASEPTPNNAHEATTLQYACPSCPKIVRTPGLLRYTCAPPPHAKPKNESTH